jgi:hypothetical protein
MSRKFATSGILIAVLACAAAVLYWVHERSAEAPVITPIGSAVPAAQPGASSSVAATEVPPSAESTASVASSADSSAASATYFLRAGERLEYTANVAKVDNVASLHLLAAGRLNFLGRDAWHLQALAHTQNPLRMVMPLDDQFDSYSDAGTFISRQYEMRLDERGQRVDSVQRMTTTASEPAPAHVTLARVLPGTRDPLGMMQLVRATDWGKTPEVHSPVYDGHKLYEARARIAGSAQVSVPAGRFTTSKIEIRVFDNGVEMKDAQFTLYIANDAERTPVLLQAVLPVATAEVALVKRTQSAP